jgi:hypothetical protein
LFCAKSVVDDCHDFSSPKPSKTGWLFIAEFTERYVHLDRKKEEEGEGWRREGEKEEKGEVKPLMVPFKIP